ncbi:MAG: ribonuclease III [Patescibacteria group bacterium]
MDLTTFEKKIGVTFKNQGFLRTAFTHRSYVNEHKHSKVEHNERLEFLGDAILEFAVTEFLFEKYPKGTEGDLTSYRAALVNTVMLSDIAGKLGINDHLLLSKGEAKDTGRARQAILANALEALIGAIFLDQGYAIVRDFIADNLFHLSDKVVSDETWRDSKSYFQELAQEKTGKTPAYETLKEVGPDHDKSFTVGVYLGSDLAGKGEGRSKQEAEQAAAEDALTAKNWR